MYNNTPIQSLQQQRLLLQMEYNEERQSFQKQAEAAGLGRRLKRGDAWYPLRIGKSYYNSLNQRCVEVFRTVDQDVEHNFEPGRPVVFFSIIEEEGKKKKQHLKFFGFTGNVSYIDGDRMVVNIPDNAHLADVEGTANVGIQMSFDETSYRTMFDALERTIKAKGNRLAYLRDLFYTPQMKTERFSFASMRFPYLNSTQEEAVNEVLRSKDVMIVHGPPGTGKTTTLVEAIYETLMRESQVLVCAQSNMAVD
ncbi:MAG: AAA family ATPase, partial [Prevotella sp.]|nr:AAA family ATPase [Prevotella sp.]